MNWQWLKKKCVDCYNLNKGTKADTEDNPFKKGTKLVFPKYCRKHKRQIHALAKLIKDNRTSPGDYQ